MKIENRFLEKVAMIPFHSCWEWTGSKDWGGYGKFRHPGGQLAHRFSFELFKSKINPGMQIDHICRNRGCVRPEHLREVTHRQNSIENSINFSAINAAKTHCLNGHAFTPDNIIRCGRNGRNCRICAKNYAREYARKKRTKITPEGKVFFSKEYGT